jgi:hypothetical protein
VGKKSGNTPSLRVFTEKKLKFDNISKCAYRIKKSGWDWRRLKLQSINYLRLKLFFKA